LAGTSTDTSIPDASGAGEREPAVVRAVSGSLLPVPIVAEDGMSARRRA